MPDTTINTTITADVNNGETLQRIEDSGEAVFAGDQEEISVERKNNTDNVIIDSSNSGLERLSIETLKEKRTALLWLSTSGAATKESVPFFQDELEPIETELKRRGAPLP